VKILEKFSLQKFKNQLHKHIFEHGSSVFEHPVYADPKL
jgi:hypothetical protein